MKKTISCIGSGIMGNALMKGAALAVGPENIWFSDVDASKAEKAAAVIGANFHKSNTDAVLTADFIFLAVKPQVLSSVLAEISPVIGERHESGNVPVFVSMAPGWTIEKIQTGLGVKSPVARIMPNTPAIISQGLIVYAFSPEISKDSAAEVLEILKGSGTTVTIEEHYLDSVTGLSGSGPAFVYVFIEALADGGVRTGLPRDKALQFAAHTVLGSAAMVLKTGKHPGELKDMVTSPGGTTIAGIAALENGAFRGSVINAVEAAWRRSAELG